MKPTTNRIIRALELGRQAIINAARDHIYNADNGEVQPPDCTFRKAESLMFLAADNARKFGAFTYLEVEAALCVWECINEWTICEKKTRRQDWVELREAVGSVELRHSSMELGVWCLEVYDLCTKNDPNFFEGEAYDWEVIPLILDHCRGAEREPLINAIFFPSPEAVAPKVMERYRWGKWLGDATRAGQKLWRYPDLVIEHAPSAKEACAAGEDPTEFIQKIGDKQGLIAAQTW